MYFAFIDESGTPKLTDSNNYFYVLIALIMHEKGFPYLNSYTKSLRHEIWDTIKDDDYIGEIPDDFELHIKDITNRKNYFKSLKEDDQK